MVFGSFGLFSAKAVRLVQNRRFFVPGIYRSRHITSGAVMPISAKGKAT